MPIYEFACHNCGGDFDKLVRSAAAIDQVTCPSCQSASVKKKLSLFSSRVGGGTVSTSASSAASCAPGGL